MQLEGPYSSSSIVLPMIIDIILGNLGFSSIRVYQWMHKGNEAHSFFKKIWKSATMLRYKIFIWLLFYDRVNTRNLLQRKSFHLPSYRCEMCDLNCVEIVLHLFWDCPFAIQCWDMIPSNRKSGICVIDELMNMVQVFPADFATDITIMACWHI